MKLEGKAPFRYEIQLTDGDTMHVEGYQSRTDLAGHMSIRTKPNSDHFDTFFPLANMFFWKRVRIDG